MDFLLWNLEWGVWYSKLKAVGKADKHRPPVLYEDINFIWDAFAALSSSRMGVSPICFSEVESYLNLNGIRNLERRQEVTHLVRVMDEKYIEFLRDKYANT